MNWDLKSSFKCWQPCMNIENVECGYEFFVPYNATYFSSFLKSSPKIEFGEFLHAI